jgi:hypothetical protein
MKLLIFLLFLASLIFVLLVGGAFGQAISTRTLNPSEPMLITVSPIVITTLLLPSAPAGTFGLGLVTEGSNSPGLVQLSHPAGSKVLVLHALSDNVAIMMTVLMDQTLFVFNLRTGPAPDIAITLIKDSTSTPVAQR